jgi:hypothetical protein
LDFILRHLGGGFSFTERGAAVLKKQAMPTGHVKALQRLQSLLGQLAEPCDADFTTPIVGREYGGDKDAGRAVCVRSLSDAIMLEELPKPLFVVESNKIPRVGSFSKGPGYAQPNHLGITLRDKVGKYFSDRHFSIRSWKAVNYANEFVSRCYDVRRTGLLSPMPLEDAVFQFDRTGLGFPEFTSDPAYLELYYRMSAAIRASGYSRDYAMSNPSVLGTRGDSSGPGLPAKKRAIFQRSRVDGNLEKQVQAVLFPRLKVHPYFAAWYGRQYVDIAVTRFMTRGKGAVLSLDFSSFDATVPFEVIDFVFKILAQWFTPESEPLILFLRESFKRSSIFTPEGLESRLRTGGIPSGSVLTNLIGSLVNLWVMAYAASATGAMIADAMVQGDDGLYRFHGLKSVEGLAKVLLEDFGMVLSTDPSKSLYSPDVVHYLQMVHSKGYVKEVLVGKEKLKLHVGVRSFIHVLNHAMSREHQRVSGWDGEYHSVRWLQQWEDASHHPSFIEGVRWLKDHDPNLEAILLKLLLGDRDFIVAAQAALNSGSDRWARIPVAALSTSSVLHAVCKLPGFETLARLLPDAR